MKANNNKTLKNLRSWDSQGLKLDDFWIFTEISKCEQLYLLFTYLLFTFRKYIVLCTHIIVVECYSFSKIVKNSRKFYFFHLIPFSAPPYCTKALLICLQNGFSHSIPSMFHVSRSRIISPSPLWSYKELDFEKSSEIPQF